MNQTIAVVVVCCTAALFAVLIPFATHRSWLLWMSRRARAAIREPWPEESLPFVTVQIPLYNERAVAGRVIDACAALSYPSSRLEIQVLDDSDDDTATIVAEHVRAWRLRGVDIHHVRRSSRSGFKAGALAHGMTLAHGEFVLIFDADFVPDPDVLRRLLAPMQDASVGMVQAAWSHLNRNQNGLTRAQAFLLDGHFLFEQGGRYAGHRFFNFNGTAGLWRRACLEAAGGWRADTLTEDLDLSYRAQMAGWSFVYLDDVHVPAEVPDRVEALHIQQRRWAQGGVQTGRLVLPRLLRGAFPRAIKVEAVVHLLGHLAHPLTWALGILLFPSAVARRVLGLEYLLPLDLFLFGAATVPFLVFYWVAGERRGVPRRGRLRSVVGTLTVGIGLSVPVSLAVLRGLLRVETPFERTPKRGTARQRSYSPNGRLVEAGLQGLMVVLLSGYLVAAIAGAFWGQIPFILLFLAGYARLGVPALLHATRPREAVEEQPSDHRGPEEPSEPNGLRPRSEIAVVG
ncbi:MAG: glycosyltransferase [Gemmatimonadota bacterium]